jgi:hypothetical protein
MGIEAIAQTVPEKVESQYDERQEDARKNR